MRWLEERRNLHRRLEDHLAYTTVPRVASGLGPGWQAEGLRLRGPRGEDFKFDLSALFDSPELVIYPARRPAGADDDPASVSVAPTARPETIVRELHAELLPVCAEMLEDSASRPDPGIGQGVSRTAGQDPPLEQAT